MERVMKNRKVYVGAAFVAVLLALGAGQAAGDVGADLHQVPATRLGVEHGVEGGDLLGAGGGGPKPGGSEPLHSRRAVAEDLLAQPQRRDHGGGAVWLRVALENGREGGVEAGHRVGGEVGEAGAGG